MTKKQKQDADKLRHEQYVVNECESIISYFEAFYIESIECHELADEKPGQIFRLVDPFEFKFVILGEKHDFMEIWSEVLRVFELAKTLSGNGSKLPPS